MKTAPLAASAVMLVMLLFSACGKVGDPRPPIVRIPTKVENLAAAQNGYSVILMWTNPAKYVDGNPASDLGMVHIFQNSVVVGMVAATAAGQPQSFPVDVTNNVGRNLAFTIQMTLPRNATASPISNSVSIQPIDVPGAPRNLRKTVDQGQIVLEWDAPERPALAESYLVQRADRPAPSVERTTRFVDSDYEPGKIYTYTATALRGTTPGAGNAALTFPAKDEKAPATPSGLRVQMIGTSAFVEWTDNTEPDLKSYRVFRSNRAAAVFVGRENGFPDPDYVPGTGLSYRIQAEDNFGNLSAVSPPQPGP